MLALRLLFDMRQDTLVSTHPKPSAGQLESVRKVHTCSATIKMDGVLPHPGMLPSGSSIASPECSRRLVGLSIDNAGSGAFRGVIQTGFPVRSASLLSRPDLALPQPRRVAEGIGRSRATRSHAQRALSREHGEDGEHRTFPAVSTVAHSRRSRIRRQRIHCDA